MPKLAILSNVTIDMVSMSLKKEYEVYQPSGFDAWQQEVLDSQSGLYCFKPEAVYILLYADEYNEKTGQMVLWEESIRQISVNLPQIPIFVSSIYIKEQSVRSYGEIGDADKKKGEWMDTLRRLRQEGMEVYLLPVEETAARIGYNHFYSNKMWYVGNMPFSIVGIKAIVELIKESYHSIKGMRKKCMAVDLDGTLWGGVIGEDGVDGIILSNHKEGQRFKDVQKLLLDMKNHGVILAALSKNNQEDVEEVFEMHPHMLLKKEDFIALEINWNSKAENIKKLADRLNIGLDAFVFLDDNPAEREQMRAMCPEVVVLDFPKDTSMLAGAVEDAYIRYFKTLGSTREDSLKTLMYQRNIKRAEVKEQAGSLDEYLRRLGIQVDIQIMTSKEEKRVVQLINKTNQFNLTTKRYSEDEVCRLADSSDSVVITAAMRDTYGDEGLVAVMILKFNGAKAEIDSFLMSCRVMGRKLEDVMISAVGDWLRTTRPEILRLNALYMKTKKNSPVEELYEKLGFSLRRRIGDKNREGFMKEYTILLKDMDVMKNVYKSVRAFK